MKKNREEKIVIISRKDLGHGISTTVAVLHSSNSHAKQSSQIFPPLMANIKSSNAVLTGRHTAEVWQQSRRHFL